MNRILVVVASVAAFAAAAASGALAGEVKGPPGTPDNENFTAAPANANSDCAYSGLNDLNPEFGQTESIVQTAADSFKFYELPHGTPGTLEACRGGTNEKRVK